MPGPLQIAALLLGLALRPAPGPVAPVAPAAPVAPVAPAAPETLLHVVQPGDCLQAIAHGYRRRAGYWRTADLMAAIRTANGLEGDLLRPGRRLLVPPAPPERHPLVTAPVRRGAGLRGIYLPGPALAASDLFTRVDAFLAAGGNGVVLDAKDVDGRVTWPAASPLAAGGRGGPAVALPELVQRLHRRGAWVAARLACFLDGELGSRRPDLALAGPDSLPWRERGLVWLDPARAEVRGYLVGLAVELAAAGVDEVQLDYVRYPTNGWRPGTAAGSAEAAALRAEADRRQAAVTAFVAEVAAALAPRGVVLSADLFAVVGWERTVDRAATGQDVVALAGLVDVLCPMVYPSHYGAGFAGVDHPGSEPRRFVAEGSRRFAELAAGRALVRPWLQAFPFGAPAYGGGYVLAQLAGARAAGASGWCLWNPAGRYGEVLPALALAAPDAAPALPVPAPLLAAAAAAPGRAGAPSGVVAAAATAPVPLRPAPAAPPLASPAAPPVVPPAAPLAGRPFRH